uniref:Uncharacterized protein n=1 Tax=viral metagenome TaxID=1070528 RepID=A0A6H1ZV60_9ZZZZ
MKVYKIEVMVIDFDELGPTSIVSAMENVRYPNCCIINLRVKDIEGVDIGEWSDDHPLNNSNTENEEYGRLFKSDRSHSR